MRAGRSAALGVVQGVAEVLPVSSSAQLVLVPWLLRWDPPADRTGFAAALHAGSCAGIAWALRDDLHALRPRDLAVLAAASAPAAVAGLLAADVVEERLGRPPQLAALLAGAGALLWWVDARAARRPLLDMPGVSSSRRGAGTVTDRQAAYAGLAQVAALVPGVSRSGAVLTVLRAAGVERSAAARFSLLLSLPLTAGAAALTLVRDRRGWQEAAPGALTAALAGATTATLAGRRGGGQVPAAARYRLGLAALVARRLLQERER